MESVKFIQVPVLGIKGKLASFFDKRLFSMLLGGIESFFCTRTFVGRHRLKNLQGRGVVT